MQNDSSKGDATASEQEQEQESAEGKGGNGNGRGAPICLAAPLAPPAPLAPLAPIALPAAQVRQEVRVVLPIHMQVVARSPPHHGRSSAVMLRPVVPAAGPPNSCTTVRGGL